MVAIVVCANAAQEAEVRATSTEDGVAAVYETDADLALWTLLVVESTDHDVVLLIHG